MSDQQTKVASIRSVHGKRLASSTIPLGQIFTQSSHSGACHKADENKRHSNCENGFVKSHEMWNRDGLQEPILKNPSYSPTCSENCDEKLIIPETSSPTAVSCLNQKKMLASQEVFIEEPNNNGFVKRFTATVEAYYPATCESRNTIGATADGGRRVMVADKKNILMRGPTKLGAIPEALGIIPETFLSNNNNTLNGQEGMQSRVVDVSTSVKHEAADPGSLQRKLDSLSTNADVDAYAVYKTACWNQDSKVPTNFLVIAENARLQYLQRKKLGGSCNLDSSILPRKSILPETLVNDISSETILYETPKNLSNRSTGTERPNNTSAQRSLNCITDQDPETVIYSIKSLPIEDSFDSSCQYSIEMSEMHVPVSERKCLIETIACSGETSDNALSTAPPPLESRRTTINEYSMVPQQPECSGTETVLLMSDFALLDNLPPPPGFDDDADVGAFQVPTDDLVTDLKVEYQAESFSLFETLPIEVWSVTNVATWLESIHLSQHCSMFVRSGIDGSHLVRLGRNELIALGLVDVKDRMMLERAIRKVCVCP